MQMHHFTRAATRARQDILAIGATLDRSSDSQRYQSPKPLKLPSADGGRPAGISNGQSDAIIAFDAITIIIWPDRG